MEYLSKKFNIFLLILILLFSFSFCTNNNRYRQLQEHNDPPGGDKKPEDDQRNPRKDEHEKEEEKMKGEYEEKVKENLLLKQQIEIKLKYITILGITGGMMLLIIIFIGIKTCIDCKYKKSINLIPFEPKIDSIENEMKNNKNEKVNIDQSNNNLLINPELSNNISINFPIQKDNSLYNNSELIEEKGKNLDAPNLEVYNGEKLNDDNKTLTNNPDVFLPSKTDKILYQPYSNEEIYQSQNKK